MTDHPTSSRGVCRNCGEPLAGHYCAYCGQEDIDYNVSLKHLLPEVLHEYFGFDSQVFASIPALLFKPGYLTNEFNAGRRERYIPPLRMYLILSALFFLLLNITGGMRRDTTRTPRSDRLTQRAQTSDSTTAQTSIPAQDSVAKNALDSTSPADNLPAARVVPPATDALTARGSITRDSGSRRTTATFNLNGLPADTNTWFGRHLYARITEMKERPQEFQNALVANSPGSAFLLMPIVALLLKLLYLRRKRFYIEHLVFSFHVHSFLFVVFSISLLLPSALMDGYGFTWVGVLLLLVYTFIALKRVYGQRWPWALTSFLAMMIAYSFVFALLLIATVVVTIVV